jgi:lipopolysaccharide export system permease protein
MKLLDRMLIWSFVKSWLVCFTSLVSLYIVIDLFNKIDDFLDAANGHASDMARIIATFYSYQIVMIFDRLCAVIVLLAAMFTIAYLQMKNELVALLSAGVSIHRVLRPLFLATLAIVALNMANRELLMPRIADQLQFSAADPQGEKTRSAYGAYEPNGILISGQNARNQGMIVYGFSCTIPEKVAGVLTHVSALEAYYIPADGSRHSGGWLLTQTDPPTLPDKWQSDRLEMIDPGKFFLRTERVDYDMVVRKPNWYQFSSTWKIFEELQRPESTRLASMAVQLHLRLTLPFLTLIMVIMGVSIILRDQSRNVFLNAGLCVVMAVCFYAISYLTKHLGEYEYLSPALSAWMPVLLFGPTSLVMLDSVHT